MIRNPPQAPLALASAWVSGVAGLFLLVGVGGSFTPVSPPLRLSFGEPTSYPLVQVQEFLAPPEETSSEPSAPEQPQTPPPVEVSIPPVPLVTPPLQPPEMAELQAAEPLAEPPPALPPQEPPPPKPAPAAEPKPKSTPAPTSPAATSKGSPSTARPARTGGTPGGSQPVPFSAAGGGRFPSPAYPSAARSARIDGTVVLLVTVESSGVPSSVEIRTSSGHTLLDTAARDHLRRNWRWPSGESRLFIVPIKFVLQ